jgi:hypothetical protein
MAQWLSKERKAKLNAWIHGPIDCLCAKYIQSNFELWQQPSGRTVEWPIDGKEKEVMVYLVTKGRENESKFIMSIGFKTRLDPKW